MSFFTLFLNQGHSPWSGVFWGVDISAMKMFFCGLAVWNAPDISFIELVKTLLSSKEHMKTVSKVLRHSHHVQCVTLYLTNFIHYCDISFLIPSP